MSTNPLILGQVRDINGSLWDVRQIRDAKYGFDLLFGSPDSHMGNRRSGSKNLIATQALVDFWEANRINYGRVRFDLPAGRTTLKRLRRRLGFNYFEDLSDFWQERIEDLKALRLKLLGRRGPELVV